MHEPSCKIGTGNSVQPIAAREAICEDTLVSSFCRAGTLLETTA